MKQRMRATAFVVASGIGGVSLLAATGARADEGRVRVQLRWTDGNACRPKPVAPAVRRLLGHDAAEGSTIVGSVQMRRTSSGHIDVRLRTRQLGREGERTFEAATCGKAFDALALILSVMLAPVETSETVAAALEPDAPHLAPPERPVEEAGEPVETQPATFSWRGGVGPRLGGDLGSLPRPTVFVGGAVSLFGPNWHVSVGAAGWLPRRSDEGPRAGTGAEVGLVAGHARGCWTFLQTPLSLDACAAMGVGRAQGRGVGLREVETSDQPWAAAGPGLTVRSPSPWLPATMALDVPILVARPTFVIDGFGTTYEASPAAIRLTVGADFIFP
ncbi:MAG: hypothetical protein AAGN82_24955 [Myxococcota bacterium]